MRTTNKAFVSAVLLAATFTSVLLPSAGAAPAKPDAAVVYSEADFSTMATITRAEVMARAKTWVDARVPYSMSAARDGWRTDCSGFVSMAWNLSKPGLSTVTLVGSNVTHRITKDELLPGDILIKGGPGTEGAAGHVRLFGGWLDSARTRYWVYEQTPPIATYNEYTWSATAAEYPPYRYNNIVGGSGRGNADITGDGKGDLFAVYQDKLRYYFGDGSGNLHWGSEGGVGWGALGEIAMGDVNGDGKGDLIAEAGGKLRYFYGDGSGNLHWGSEGGSGWEAVKHLNLEDVNGDGKADIVGVVGDKLRYYYGDGTGNFHLHSEGGSGWGALSKLEAGDVNGDGRADLVAVAGDQLRYFYGDGSGNFHWGSEGGTGWGSLGHLAVTDMNGDGKGDLLAVAGDKLRYFYGDGTGNFHWGHEGGAGWSTLTRFAG
ncbi:VCBS repeat-containing protein [Lentzea sp. DG1S-22]|uniref:C40 family peptidase n=1 Tax=Lentzea sp. DG1S-22 TaxID=3108822 RepID=UPI002E798FF5|nr:VCBS repeat-containing protein [Lentzea sp. DG1S-22]WVH77749.1 VCBS repeat-containing protein [Lentzea sp. DG1S-22]